SGLFLEKPDDEQKNHGPDDGVDDRRQDAADEDESNLRQEPAGDDCADDADNDVTDEPKAITLHDQASEPAGNGADDQPNDQRLNHRNPPLHQPSGRQRPRPAAGRDYRLMAARPL